jgi:anti-sigma B factor antagonist
VSDPYPRMSASPLLHVDITRPAPATIRIALAGEVDLATARDLSDRLLSVLHAEHPAVLEVDLIDVSFLACAGVGALACVRSAAVRAGCQLRLIRPQPIVGMVLELTGMLADLTAPNTTSPAEASWAGYPAQPQTAATTMTPTPEAMLAA